MALVTVTTLAGHVRLDDAEASTGWSGIGGGQGPSAEGSFPYQGSNLVNRKVTSTGGVYYDPTGDGGSAQDVTATAIAHWMVKSIVTDSGGLNATMGVAARIGSSTTAYQQICISGTDAAKSAYNQYTPRGGLFIVPVNPNISGYRTTSGSPTLTASDYFGLYVDLDTGSAKSENVGCDAIDLGTGLVLTAGDGGSTEGVWQDFVDEDEGTIANRWGFAQSLNNSIKAFFGEMKVGGAVTEFDDSESQVLWPDGMFSAGFSRAFFDLTNASTILNDGSLHTSLGTTNVVDTRADFIWSGTSGTGTASHTLINFRNYALTSAVVLDGADIDIVDLSLSGGEIKNSTIKCNSATNVAVCNDVVFGTSSGIHETTIEQGLNGLGHAFEITSTTELDLTDVVFSGFGGTVGSNLVSNSGASDAAIYNNSGGALTINILGDGSSPSIRNGAGATTTVVTGLITVQVTVLDDETGSPLPNARVQLYDSSDYTTVILNSATNVSGIASTTLSYVSDIDVSGWAREWDLNGVDYTPKDISGTITSSGLSLTVRLTPIN